MPAIAVEAGLVLVLARRRIYQTLPAFMLLICWGLIYDLTSFTLDFVAEPSWSRLSFYHATLIIEAAITIGVLGELAWRVLCSSNYFEPQPSQTVVTAAIILIGCLIWLFTGLMPEPSAVPPVIMLLRFEQTVALLIVFVVLVIYFETYKRQARRVFIARYGGTCFRARARHDHKFHVASGLGLSSLVFLDSPVNYSRQGMSLVNEQLFSLIDVGIFVYWIVAFSRSSSGVPSSPDASP